MRALSRWTTASAGTALAATALALCVHAWAPAPDAAVARGGEQVFLRGAHEREVTREGVRRHLGPVARFAFRHLPAGPARLDVAYRHAPTPVLVVVNGAVVATMPEGSRSAAFDLHLPGRRLDVELRSEGRRAGGRVVGPQLERVGLVHERRGLPGPGLVGLYAGVALLALAAARLAGLGAWWAAGVALGLTGVQAAAAWPSGMLRSGYAATLALQLAVGVLLALLFARGVARRRPVAGPWAFAALLLAWSVQFVAAVSPLMVVSDALFHAHKLGAVARGELFPTSVTQHAQPFRFPYGVSFYLLLAPLARLGLDPVELVRAGAAFFSVLGSAALFALLAAAPVRAALAVVVLQFLPATFEVFSYGNLSNVFGQALTLVFFAWWAGAAPGGALVGAALFTAGALAHFSSLVVLGVLLAALVLARRGMGLPAARADPRRRAALWGLGAACGYYACFLPLMFEQLPRLLEGAGRGGGASPWAALAAQAPWWLVRLGWPALVLALAGLPRPSRGGLDRDLAAYWWTGGALCLLALVSPIEVRYLYALTVPLSVAAADGALSAAARGRWGGAAALVTLAALVGLGARELTEALLTRYRV